MSTTPKPSPQPEQTPKLEAAFEITSSLSAAILTDGSRWFIRRSKRLEPEPATAREALEFLGEMYDAIERFNVMDTELIHGELGRLIREGLADDGSTVDLAPARKGGSR